MVQYRRIPLSRLKRKDTPILFVEKNRSAGQTIRFCILGQEQSEILSVLGAKSESVRVVRPWGPHGGVHHSKGGHWFKSRLPKAWKSKEDDEDDDDDDDDDNDNDDDDDDDNDNDDDNDDDEDNSAVVASSSTRSPVEIAQLARLGNTMPYPSATRIDVYTQGFRTIGRVDKIESVRILAYASTKILQAQRIGVRCVKKLCNHLVERYRHDLTREWFPLTKMKTLSQSICSMFGMLKEEAWRIAVICKFCFSRKAPGDMLRRIAEKCGIESSNNTIPRKGIVSYMMKLLKMEITPNVQTLMEDISNNASDREIGLRLVAFLQSYEGETETSQDVCVRTFDRAGLEEMTRGKKIPDLNTDDKEMLLNLLLPGFKTLQVRSSIEIDVNVKNKSKDVVKKIESLRSCFVECIAIFLECSTKSHLESVWSELASQIRCSVFIELKNDDPENEKCKSKLDVFNNCGNLVSRFATILSTKKGYGDDENTSIFKFLRLKPQFCT